MEISLNELKENLKAKFDGEVNLFLHGIDLEKGKGEEVSKKILQEGLKHSYLTMFRTVRDIGKVKFVKEENLHYSFCSGDNHRAINVLLAIPDILKYQDEVLPIYPSDLERKLSLNDDGGYRCFLDVILNNAQGIPITIPKEFIYGVYVLNTKTRETLFYENPYHYSKLPLQQYISFFESYKQLLIKSHHDFFVNMSKSTQSLDRAKRLSKHFVIFDRGISNYVYEEMIKTLKNVR